jgi:hypothetical protein
MAAAAGAGCFSVLFPDSPETRMDDRRVDVASDHSSSTLMVNSYLRVPICSLVP